MERRKRETKTVAVGDVLIGGGNPVVVQAMTNTETADAAATAAQALALAEAGAELVRFTVNTPAAAAAVPEIRKRLHDAGCGVPLIGDFHYNGDRLLADHPECARLLDKYRINPGNVGRGKGRDDRFAAICRLAADLGKAVRIGVNMGSLDSELVAAEMKRNAEENLGRTSEEVYGECMLLSALRSVEAARQYGLGEDRIVVSCKCSTPTDLIALYRRLAWQTAQPLHLGLTEAGMGLKGLVWSAASMGVLLAEGVGETVRVSLTPRPGGDRREEVWASCELLQALGLRSFSPSVTTCPGCGRTAGDIYQRLAEDAQAFIREKTPAWRKRFVGVENLRLAVMGCVVNGPGESKAAHIGISLPGTGESPHCPVFVDGKKFAVLSGTPEELSAAFLKIVAEYVEKLPPKRRDS